MIEDQLKDNKHKQHLNNFNHFIGLVPFVTQVNTHLKWKTEYYLLNVELHLLDTYKCLEHIQILTQLVWHLTTNHQEPKIKIDAWVSMLDNDVINKDKLPEAMDLRMINNNT